MNEYLDLKKKSDGFIEKKILDVLKTGLNSNSYEDILKGISRLLVENQQLLSILRKVKKCYQIDANLSLDELDKEIEARIN